MYQTTIVSHFQIKMAAIYKVLNDVLTSIYAVSFNPETLNTKILRQFSHFL